MKYIFGPVPSRRLGMSLGVDIIPHKTCSLDCVYCECGKTTNLTVKRKEYIPAGEVINELSIYLKDNPKLDYITFSGAGEPLLNDSIDKIIDFIKDNYDYKTAILTNSSLFYDNSIIDKILRADLIKASLDAATEKIFKKINRPHPMLNLIEIIKGLIFLKKRFKGEFILEVFIVPDINDNEKELKEIKEVIKKLEPVKVQINTLDRPSAESWVKPANKEDIIKIAEYLNGAEVLKPPLKKNPIMERRNLETKEAVISTISRRPCTMEDISSFTGTNIEEIEKILTYLEKENKIEKIKLDRGMFYKINI